MMYMLTDSDTCPDMKPSIWTGVQPPKNVAPDRYATSVAPCSAFLQPLLVVPAKNHDRLRFALTSHAAGEPSYTLSIQSGHKNDGTSVQGTPAVLLSSPK